jgi:hypothetical protein
VLLVAAGEANAGEELLHGAVAPVTVGGPAAAAPVVPEFAVAPRAGEVAEGALHALSRIRKHELIAPMINSKMYVQVNLVYQRKHELVAVMIKMCFNPASELVLPKQTLLQADLT